MAGRTRNSQERVAGRTRLRPFFPAWDTVHPVWDWLSDAENFPCPGVLDHGSQRSAVKSRCTKQTASSPVPGPRPTTGLLAPQSDKGMAVPPGQFFGRQGQGRATGRALGSCQTLGDLQCTRNGQGAGMTIHRIRLTLDLCFPPKCRSFFSQHVGFWLMKPCS